MGKPKTYQSEIQKLVARVASISPHQVFVTVEKSKKQVLLSWQASMLLTREQSAEIKAQAQALLPAELAEFQVVVS